MHHAMHKRICATAAVLAATLAFVFAPGADAAGLPKATQKALADLKLDASTLDGLDAELNVPKAWLDGAAKEKNVVILGTWANNEFAQMTAPFRERYPFVNLKYSRSGTNQRTIQVLVALGEGRVIADVLTSVSDATFQFKEMKALADLRDLPGYKNLDKGMVASDGTWLAHKLSFRCLAYNTDKVKKTDLPKTWDDLVTNPVWRNGNLALDNHPEAWLLMLWDDKGDKWGEDFTRRLFNDVQPQRRSEGMTAVTSLAAGGEFGAALPSPEWVAEKLSKKGAPLGYHCPSPVPVTVSQIVMLEKSPHKDAARLFINWMVSKEGQILQYADTFAVPVHKDLQTKRFLPFSDTILGKPHLVRDDAALNSDQNKRMLKIWQGYWNAGKVFGGKGGKGGKGE